MFQSAYHDLLQDAEETLRAEGLFMLYDLSWRLNAVSPDIPPAEGKSLFEAVYAELRRRHHLRQVFVDWPHHTVTSDAETLAPDFWLEPNQPPRPVMALVAVADLPSEYEP